MAFLGAAGIFLGLVGGASAFAVVRLVGLVSNLALLHRVGFSLPDLRHYHPGPSLIAVAVAGALFVTVLAKWSPVIKGHGIPESLEAILLRESRIAPRSAVAKPLSAAVAMGTGGPFGAEGPIIVTGGAVGSLMGQVLTVSSAERRILLATGAAAGMAGVFDTPAAAVVLAFELLLFERSLRALVPLCFATSIAAGLHLVLIGNHPLFQILHLFVVPASQLPWFALLGIPVGLLAVVLNKGLFAVESLYRKLPFGAIWHPVVGAVGFALIGLAVPGSLSVGYWAITDTVNGSFPLRTTASIFAAKTASWWVALGSGTSGGTLAPMFLIGGTMGSMFGTALATAFPGAHLIPEAFAVAAMGAAFGVGARALLTGTVFAVEVTGSPIELMVPLLLTTAVAELLVEWFLSDRIMTDKLIRRGYRIDFDAQTSVLRRRMVYQAMEPDEGEADPDAVSIGAMALLAEALPLFLGAGMKEVQVLEGGRRVGWLHYRAVDEALVLWLAEDDMQPGKLTRKRRSWRELESAEQNDSQQGPEVQEPEPEVERAAGQDRPGQGGKGAAGQEPQERAPGPALAKGVPRRAGDEDDPSPAEGHLPAPPAAPPAAPQAGADDLRPPERFCDQADNEELF